MKTWFLKYCLSVAALFFVAFSCFPNNAQPLQFGKENTQADSGYFHNDKKVASHLILKKVTEESFHKQNLHRTFVNHSKGSFTETQYEAQNTLTLKKSKTLIKFNPLWFVSAVPYKYCNKKSGAIPFKYSFFNSFMQDALYIKLQVMRL